LSGEVLGLDHLNFLSHLEALHPRFYYSGSVHPEDQLSDSVLEVYSEEFEEFEEFVEVLEVWVGVLGVYSDFEKGFGKIVHVLGRASEDHDETVGYDML
jgi:hypothetical protein